MQELATMAAVDLDAMVGKVVGAVRVNRPVEHRRADYECAAWWELARSETGVFPVVLRQDYHNKSRYYLHATLPGKAVDGYFAALWCGVPVGREPYVYRDAGSRREISITCDLAEGVGQTMLCGAEQAAEVRWCVYPEFWGLALAASAREVLRMQAWLAENWAKVAAPAQRGEYDTLETVLGSATWAAEQMGVHGRKVEAVARQVRYREEDGGRYDTNWAWALPCRPARRVLPSVQP